MPISVQEVYPAVHQGKIYIAGGIVTTGGGLGFTDKSFVYDPKMDRWQDAPALPQTLHHVALLSTGDQLLAFGGFNGGAGHPWRMRDTVYQLEDDRWQPIYAMPTPQAEGVVTLHNKTIHIVTGQQPRGKANQQRSDHIEGNLHWTLDRGQWHTLAPIPTPRNSATGGWIDDVMVITGGRTANGNLSTTEIYDAKADRWHTAAPLPLPQAGTASVVVNNELVVFGGEIFTPQAGVFPNVWRYNLAADQWRALPDLPTPRHGLGACLIGNRAYVIAGATAPGGRGTTGVNEVLNFA